MLLNEFSVLLGVVLVGLGLAGTELAGIELAGIGRCCQAVSERSSEESLVSHVLVFSEVQLISALPC